MHIGTLACYVKCLLIIIQLVKLIESCCQQQISTLSLTYLKLLKEKKLMSKNE